ncbi:hypothetical protein CJU81_23240 [Pseudomonas fragi]|uniref:Uncharacterized protein n=1 Tax=Pseudomonas fragi TaxID=296 RepID=A0A266ZUA5_PSEFR|nr:hypothetical protein CJU81_23240 [Pseudomonas fragi]
MKEARRRPNAGAVMGVARQDAAPAAMGQGWPVAACPHNSAGVRAPASLGEAAVWQGKAFLLTFVAV